MSAAPHPLAADRLPVLALLAPRRHLWPLLAVIVIGVIGSALAVGLAGVPLWAASAGVLVALAAALAPKWREDWRRFGLAAALLEVAVALQTVRVVEHGAQWVQLHVLRWHPLDVTGLLSGGDVDGLPFAAALAMLLLWSFLMGRGVRNPWAWALLAVAALHTVDTGYALWRSVQIGQELRALGAAEVSAEYLRLPGIFGRDGWLATADATRATPLGRLPGLTTAPRPDIQFWWALLELALLLPAANAFIARPRRATNA
jgi:hypothetical protein